MRQLLMGINGHGFVVCEFGRKPSGPFVFAHARSGRFGWARCLRQRGKQQSKVSEGRTYGLYLHFLEKPPRHGFVIARGGAYPMLVSVSESMRPLWGGSVCRRWGGGFLIGS